MNVLNRIIQLRMERNWSEYELSQKSGITQSTISTWYRKNTIPSIPSLEKICKAFDITLSEFFIEDNSKSVELTATQLQLIHYSEKLTSSQLEHLLLFLESL